MTAGPDWAAILEKAGIPEPPGYIETRDRMRAVKLQREADQLAALRESLDQTRPRPAKRKRRR